jgi:hypothetical protein
VRTTCLVCFISTVNGLSEKMKPWKTGASSGHITNLRQSIFETFDIYDGHQQFCLWSEAHGPLSFGISLKSHNKFLSISFITPFINSLIKTCKETILIARYSNLTFYLLWLYAFDFVYKYFALMLNKSVLTWT